MSPDWKPVNSWELRASYSYLEMELENKATSNDPGTAAAYNGSSPRHQVVIQSFMNLPKKMEFDQTYRYVSALPAQTVRSYQTMDTRFGWHISARTGVVGRRSKSVATAFRPVRRRSRRAG